MVSPSDQCVCLTQGYRLAKELDVFVKNEKGEDYHTRQVRRRHYGLK
jgi:hypothetical protein